MKELFIQIPSSALAMGSDKKLTVEEINLFAWLQTMITWLDFGDKNYHISCDLDLLVKVLGLNKNNLSRGKKKVRENLISLQKKGYLSFIETDYKTLEIKLKIKQDDVKVKPNFANKEMNYKGFIKIPISLLNQVKTKYDITIIALVVYRGGLKTYQITRSEWGEVLDVSVKTAVDVVNKCKLVETTIGKYISENRQEANTYNIKMDNDNVNLQDETIIDSNLQEVSRNKQSKKEENGAIENMHRKIKDPKVVENFDLFKKLVDFGTKLDSDAYLVYLETEDLELKEYTERKIEKMKSSDKGEIILEKIIRGAHEVRRSRELKKNRETFGTKAYFEEKRKESINAYQMGLISGEEYEQYNKYVDEQLENLEEGIEVTKFEGFEFEREKFEEEKEEKFIEEIDVKDTNGKQVEDKIDFFSLKEENEDKIFSIDGLKKKMKSMSKNEDMIDNMLKKISDERVKYDKQLFKEMQDYGVKMSLYAYEIYMTTDDGVLRKYAQKKLNQNPSMHIELDKAYREKILKRIS
ncbi:MAG: hypothetical protein ACRCXQ_01655 [Vagococcus fluvialis]